MPVDHGQDEVDDREAVAHQRWVLIGIAMVGLLLIAASIVLPLQDGLAVPRALLKELGVAVLAVFTVSYIYEVGLAKRYMSRFLGHMRAEIMKGHGNAAACAVMGIDEIFRDRLEYERLYGIFHQLRDRDPSTRVRLVARSAFTVVGHAAEELTRLVKAGGCVEICILDPRMSDTELAWNVDAARLDITHTLTMLADIVVADLSTAQDKGELTIALHRVPMLDSFLSITHAHQSWCTWDFSFGRDTSRKNVLMLDTKKPLGANVCGRYEHVWTRSEKIFVYKNGAVQSNLLPQVLGIVRESSAPKSEPLVPRPALGGGAPPP
jgi:hypothetical protein